MVDLYGCKNWFGFNLHNETNSAPFLSVSVVPFPLTKQNIIKWEVGFSVSLN